MKGDLQLSRWEVWVLWAFGLLMFILGGALIVLAVSALLSPSLADEVRSAWAGRRLFSLIFLVGGAGLLYQTFRADRGGYVWIGPFTTLARRRYPGLARTILLSHYVTAAAMVSMGAILWG